MLRYEIQKYGGPEGLKLIDRPSAEPGDLDVVVRIKAASLNYRDLVVLQGKYDRNPVQGRVPLSDGAGEVAAVGTAVTQIQGRRPGGGLFFSGLACGPLRGRDASYCAGRCH